jgi:hypothetical protein
VEQDSRINVSKFNGNEPTQETIECLASTAELLRPKKRIKVEELSTITTLPDGFDETPPPFSGRPGLLDP